MSVKLFVYGTLRKPRIDYDEHGGLEWAGAWLDEYVALRVPATTRGYIDRTTFYFPCAVFSAKGGVIDGELLTLRDGIESEVLAELDRYEGVAQGLFRHVTIPVHVAGQYAPLTEAIAYEYADRRYKVRGIEEGRSDHAETTERMDIQGVGGVPAEGGRDARACETSPYSTSCCTNRRTRVSARESDSAPITATGASARESTRKHLAAGESPSIPGDTNAVARTDSERLVRVQDAMGQHHRTGASNNGN